MSPLLLLVFLGCGRVSEWVAPAGSGVLFPHSDGYATAAGHGADIANRGVQVCTPCHDAAPGSAFCGTCHAGYPHLEGWSAGAVHGAGWADSAESKAACEACHAAAGTTAGTLGCSGCHASYPHAGGWGALDQHGAYAFARGDLAAACGPCHGVSLEGTETAPACTRCHPSYPHAADWQEGHRAADTTTCTACHGAGDGGDARVACSRCHASFPHGAGWGLGHARDASLHGEGPCMGCHVAGAGPGSMPATCAPTCHGGEG